MALLIKKKKKKRNAASLLSGLSPLHVFTGMRGWAVVRGVRHAQVTAFLGFGPRFPSPCTVLLHVTSGKVFTYSEAIVLSTPVPSLLLPPTEQKLSTVCVLSSQYRILWHEAKDSLCPCCSYFMPR